jgi:hypothetical protein
MIKTKTMMKWVSIILLICVVSLMLMAFTPAEPTGAPPPRPTLAPTSEPQPEGETAVGQIILTVDNPSTELWTEVEWLDEHGEWKQVAGWQDKFNEYGFVSWTVAASDFNKGPFRWLVYLCTCLPFSLLTTSSAHYLAMTLFLLF